MFRSAFRPFPLLAFAAAFGLVGCDPLNEEPLSTDEDQAVNTTEGSSSSEFDSPVGSSSSVRRDTVALPEGFSLQNPTTNLERLAGYSDMVEIDGRTITLEGMTASGLGNAGWVDVINSMGQTRTILTVTDGTYSQDIEVSTGDNKIVITILDGTTVVEDGLLEVTNTETAAVYVRVRLTWEQDLSDVDLYVTSPSGVVTYYLSPQTELGMLDIDDVDGFGPETFALTNPEPGTYQVGVNLYGAHGQLDSIRAHTVISYGEQPWETLGSVTLDPMTEDAGQTIVPVATFTVP